MLPMKDLRTNEYVNEKRVEISKIYFKNKNTVKVKEPSLHLTRLNPFCFTNIDVIDIKKVFL